MTEFDLRRSRTESRTDVRAAVLAAATRILAEDGVGALTVRQVAQRVNASTKVVYTLFGGKEGLLEALYVEAFDGLARETRASLTARDPAARVLAMARAYRRYALAHPDRYSVMFGEAFAGFKPSQEARRHAWSTFTGMRDAMAACQPGMSREDADFAMRAVWAALHGVVSLELRDILGPQALSDDLLDVTVAAICGRFGIVLPVAP